MAASIVPYRLSSPNPYSPANQEAYPVEYFSGVDISIFFGGNYIDEITEFECTLTERRVPVYGYASYTANKIVPGTRIVQGSFCINMRPMDYLHELLNSTGTPSPASVTNTTNVANALLALGGALTAASTPATSGTPNYSSLVASGSAGAPDPSIDPDGYAQWQTNQKALLWGVQEGIINLSPPDLSTVPYFTQADFQILLIYGDIDTIDLSNRNSGRIRTIEKVSLYGAQQAIDMSGENIKERFQFIGTDINAPNRIAATL